MILLRDNKQLRGEGVSVAHILPKRHSPPPRLALPPRACEAAPALMAPPGGRHVGPPPHHAPRPPRTAAGGGGPWDAVWDAWEADAALAAPDASLRQRRTGWSLFGGSRRSTAAAVRNAQAAVGNNNAQGSAQGAMLASELHMQTERWCHTMEAEARELRRANATQESELAAARAALMIAAGAGPSRIAAAAPPPQVDAVDARLQQVAADAEAALAALRRAVELVTSSPPTGLQPPPVPSRSAASQQVAANWHAAEAAPGLVPPPNSSAAVQPTTSQEPLIASAQQPLATVTQLPRSPRPAPPEGVAGSGSGIPVYTADVDNIGQFSDEEGVLWSQQFAKTAPMSVRMLLSRSNRAPFASYLPHRPGLADLAAHYVVCRRRTRWATAESRPPAAPPT